MKLLLIACVLIILHLVDTSIATTDTPKELRIVNRTEWGARAFRSTTPQRIPIPFVVIHHGGIAEYCDNITTCAQIIRSYQKLHMDDRAWDDIGYSFLIGEDGNVYEGRGWQRVGAHAPLYNNQSIGICVIGDFTKRLPNQLALDAVHDLITYGVKEGLIIPDYTLLGHRQARDTECPGEILYQEITTWPHWDHSPSPRKYYNCTMCGDNAGSGTTTSLLLMLLFPILQFLAL